MTVTRAAVYARISEIDAPDDEHGVQNQADAAEKLVRERGWELVTTYVDNDVRASKGKKASAQYHEMMTAAARRKFDNIVVWQTSRLWRNRRERAEGIEILREAAISVIAVKGPSLDMSHAYGRAMAGLLGEFDTLETEVKAERQVLANAAAAKEGKRSAGVRPFGWQADRLTADPAEAAAIRAGIEVLLAGGTVASVCRLWTGLGLQPRRSDRWQSNTVRKTLTNPEICGLNSFKGEIIGQGSWDALVSEEQWRAVVALLRDPGRRNPAGAATLGGGLYRCRCGNVVAASVNGSGIRIYRCQRYSRGDRPGPHVSARLIEVDDLVEAVVIERLSRPDLADLLAPPSADTAALRAEAARIRASLASDAVDELKGLLTRAQLAARTSFGTKRLDEIAAELAAAGSASVLAVFLTGERAQDVWDRLDLSVKRAVIKVLLTVTIKPSRRACGFDEDCVGFGPPS